MQRIPTHLKRIFDIPLFPVVCLDTQTKSVQIWKEPFHQQTAPASTLALSDTTGLNGFVYQALDTLGKLAQVDRVSVWATLPPPSDSPISSDDLQREPRINDPIKSLPNKESPKELLSVMAASITLQDRLWGAVAFDACQAERIWTDREENILRTAAVLIANVLESHHVFMEARDIALRLEEFEQTEKRKCEFPDHETAEKYPFQHGHYLQRLTASAKTLLHIINDVLDFSKVEAGELTIRHTPFMVRNIVHEIYEEAFCHSQKKGITIDYAIADSVPEILVGDARLLSHILKNLIENALTFTHQGKISLSIDIQEKDDAQGFLHCTVSDTGVGLRSEHIEHIFTPFAHVGRATTQKGDGMGLGLALCKKLIEAMGGTIRCESVLGIGSTFSFRIAVGMAGAIARTQATTVLRTAARQPPGRARQ